MPRLLQLASSVALAFLLTGCGKNWTMNDQVEGTVKLDGKELAGVMVEFIPDVDPKVQAPISRATTDDKGHFVLTCANGKSGAVIGKHNIVIHPSRTEDASLDAKNDKAKDKDSKKGPSIPESYSLVTKTPLKSEVTADKHDYALEVSSKAPSGTTSKPPGAGSAGTRQP